MFQAQKEMISKLSEITSTLTKSKKDRPSKISDLREMLSTEYKELCSFSPPMVFPLNPKLTAIGIIPETATLYKSALLPLGFQVVVNKENEEKTSKYRVIYKKGDDLRQDQLITQIIRLMDVLLKKEGMEMFLSPYRVLATSRNEGFIEVVENASNLAHVLEKYNNRIQNFFFEHNRTTKDVADAFDRYIKSCSAYCVITFILGIGDRHFDNLLLNEDGRLFHVDFGFILGKDPKPFPPPIRINKEMIEGMGGLESEEYKIFLLYAVRVYNVLRKHSHFIINLFTLMVDGGIGNIETEKESIPKLLQKFRLDLTDPQAAEFMITMIEECVSSLFPEVIERLHTFVQKRKK
eukprot:TRINITY_DN13603_c0_g1_i1.p1 TRINITY_DN13603_c0_g1~~TRINITY_DN13603_c0_g1_i1.p1  ORF type:complete len:350 (+),score=108.32 TRINITY_DN13603_c0_g1_i1:330-1379(+)